MKPGGSQWCNSSMRRLQALLVVVVAACALAPAAHAFLGEQKMLVIRVTWGPEPFTDAQVQSVVYDQTAAFMRASSFGKTSIAGTWTPWFRVFAAQAPCDLQEIERVGRAAAQQAGYDLTAYNRFAFLFPRIGCWWTGYGTGENIFLNGALTRTLVAHELGHTYGLSHANTWECLHGSCDAYEYGDPYDTMGRGDGDYNAWEKMRLGWITNTLAAAGAGFYTIDRPDRPSALPQAFSVATARTEYWFENRQEPLPTLSSGVLVRTTGPPTTPPQFRAPGLQTLLLPNAGGTGRVAVPVGRHVRARCAQDHGARREARTAGAFRRALGRGRRVRQRGRRVRRRPGRSPADPRGRAVSADALRDLRHARARRAPRDRAGDRPRRQPRARRREALHGRAR
jgi:hypothetical protein